MNRAGGGEAAVAGCCRHCGCTELGPCRLEDGETCVWLDSTRAVCSAPGCIVRERQRLRAREARMKAPRRRTPAEVHEEIMREAREKRRRARKRRAA